MQTKLHSFFESFTNIFIGYVIAIATQLLVFPLFGIEIDMTDNLLIGAIFTIISLFRSYVIRRFYNKKVVCPSCGYSK